MYSAQANESKNCLIRLNNKITAVKNRTYTIKRMYKSCFIIFEAESASDFLYLQFNIIYLPTIPAVAMHRFTAYLLIFKTDKLKLIFLHKSLTLFDFGKFPGFTANASETRMLQSEKRIHFFCRIFVF